MIAVTPSPSMRLAVSLPLVGLFICYLLTWVRVYWSHLPFEELRRKRTPTMRRQNMPQPLIQAAAQLEQGLLLGRPVRTASDLQRFLDPVLGAACAMCFTGS